MHRIELRLRIQQQTLNGNVTKQLAVAALESVANTDKVFEGLYQEKEVLAAA